MRLTDKVVATLPCPPQGNRIYYDDEVKGFGIRVTKAGGRAFVLSYRCRLDHRERRYTLGSFPDWNVASARDEAKRLKRNIDLGGDPVGELRAGRAAPTVSDLAERFLAEYLPRLKPRTRRDYRQNITTDILPVLGRLKVAAIEFEHIDRLHRAISTRAPVHANRVLACLSRLFSVAMLWKLRTTNPCRGITRNVEEKRDRYLTPEELPRFIAAVDAARDQDAANALRLLLLTGARTSELLFARWADIDLDAARWSKPGSTIKRSTRHYVPLNGLALEILAAMKANATSEWLFPAPRGSGPRKEVRTAFAYVRKHAALVDFNIHDLRHTHATLIVSHGFSLPLLGALLDHTSAQTTLRYAHMLDSPQRLATETVATVVRGAKQ